MLDLVYIIYYTPQREQRIKGHKLGFASGMTGMRYTSNRQWRVIGLQYKYADKIVLCVCTERGFR